MSHWAHLGERGSVLGIRILIACFRWIGPQAARLLLAPIVFYFFLTGRAARSASRAYLKRLAAFTGKNDEPHYLDSYRHMLAFAESGLDKFAAWAGRFDNSRLDFPRQADFDRLLASGKGAVIIGSHLGNLEMTRALATDQRRAVVNAVMYTDHAQRFNDLLDQSNEKFQLNLIQVSKLGADTAVMLKEKVDRGELLVIVGDRTPPQENGRVCQVDFMGKPASFAQGPMILASLLECPVYLFFCLREKDRYRVYFEHFADRIELPRAQRQVRLQDYLQRYARRLEHYCQLAPYQWFNFFDFWRDASQPATNQTRS